MLCVNTPLQFQCKKYLNEQTVVMLEIKCDIGNSKITYIETFFMNPLLIYTLRPLQANASKVYGNTRRSSVLVSESDSLSFP